MLLNKICHSYCKCNFTGRLRSVLALFDALASSDACGIRIGLGSCFQWETGSLLCVWNSCDSIPNLFYYEILRLGLGWFEQ